MSISAGFLGADSNPVADETIAQVLEQTGHSIVSPRAAGDRDLDLAQIQIHLIVDHADPVGGQAVISGNRSDRLAALIHIGERFHSDDRARRRVADATDHGVELRRPLPGCPVASRISVDDQKPDIVSGLLVFFSRIAETGNKPRGHSQRTGVETPGIIHFL